MAVNGRSGRSAGSAESGNKPNAAQPIRLIKKRKKRQLSFDAEIRAAAKQIHDTQMADAMKAGALIVVGRKLDTIFGQINEIRAILNAAGLQGTIGSPVYAAPPPQLNARPVQPAGPLCAICGNPAVRKAKPNRFTIGEPAWYCRVHQALAGQIEAEDRVDGALIGAQGPVVKPKPVVVVTNAPAQMTKQAEVVEPEPEVDNLASAMAALGVTEGE